MALTRKISEIPTQASPLAVDDRLEITQDMGGVPVTRYVTPGQITDYVEGDLTTLPAGLVTDAMVNASAAIADTKLGTIATAGKVSNSATTATAANTASAIVARDASGNFTAGTVTAALAGNATTATTADKVANALTAGTYLTAAGTFDGAAARTFAVDATDANTASKVVARDASGNFAAGTITAALNGNATTATSAGSATTAAALSPGATINGVTFTGAAPVTIAADAGTLTGSTLAAGVTASSLTSVGTLSSLTVSGDLTVDTSTLKVDSANNRVGVRKASPQFPLDVNAGTNVNLVVAESSGELNLIAINDAYSAGIAVRTDAGSHRWFSGSNALTYDASGNLGLGVTPSAWINGRGIDVGAYVGLSDNPSGGGGFGLSSNAYEYASGAWKYKNTYFATLYRTFAGEHQWLTAPSGTAGNAITFTQAMTLDAGGQLGLGIAAPTQNGGGTSKVFHVNATGAGDWATTHYTNGSTGTTGSDGLIVGNIGADAVVLNYENSPLQFWTNSSERARVTAGGYFKASNTGSYVSATGPYHELSQTVDTTILAWYSHQGADPYGPRTDFIAASPNNTANYFEQYSDSTTVRAVLYSNGDWQNVNGVYATISDAKLKQDITDAGSSWDDLKAVRFRKYRFISDVEAKGDDAPYLLGVIAQELRETSPGLVDAHPDTERVEVEDEDGNVTTETRPTGTETLSVKQSILLMKAAVALQEAMARIETLEARLDALET